MMSGFSLLVGWFRLKAAGGLDTLVLAIQSTLRRPVTASFLALALIAFFFCFE